MTHLKDKAWKDAQKKKAPKQSNEEFLAEAKKGEELAAARLRERAEKYPECEKLSGAASERLSIESFFDWLDDKKFTVCERSEGINWSEYLPVTTSRDRLILDFLGVDPVKLEAERRAMLDELQAKADAASA